MKRIGLTGGLASGKSTASGFFADQGAHVIDADKLGHRVYEPGTPGHSKVVETFGETVLAADGQIDRKALGGIVFGNPDQLKRLTDVVWPEIRRLAEEEMASFCEGEPDGIVVLEAAVLFEAGWEDAVDEIWVVVVDRDTAVDRAMARDNAPREAVESRLDAQLSNDERVRRADVVIENNGNLDNFMAQLEAAWEKVVG